MKKQEYADENELLKERIAILTKEINMMVIFVDKMNLREN